MSTTVPHLNETEVWTAQSSLKQRYGRDLQVRLAGTDVRFSRYTPNMSICPTRARVDQLFGTGIEEYDNLTECVVTLTSTDGLTREWFAANPTFIELKQISSHNFLPCRDTTETAREYL